LEFLLLISRLRTLRRLHLLKTIRSSTQALLSLRAETFPLWFELLQYLSLFE
jgi:hypothetical protein